MDAAWAGRFGSPCAIVDWTDDIERWTGDGASLMTVESCGMALRGARISGFQ